MAQYRRLPAVLLLVLLVLGGCGQKGPLYRGSPDAQQPPAADSDPAVTASESGNRDDQD